MPLVMLTFLGQSVESDLFAATLTKPIKPAQLQNILIDTLFPQLVPVPVSTPEVSPASGTMRILLAEDNPSSQKVTLQMLKKLGYRSDVVANGREVLEALDRQRYDLILMDVRMPEMNGLETRPPRSQLEHIITKSLLARSYLLLGSVQSLAAISAFYFQYWTNGYWGQFLGLPSSGQLYMSGTSMTLAAVVITQIGNLFAQKTERRSILKSDIFSNPLIWVGIGSALVIILAIIYFPQLQWIFGTAASP